jgi:hypothetical protein
MCWWHGTQTTSVLRRIFAMSAAHAGWPGPGMPSCLRPATWCTATRGAFVAQLAVPSPEPQEKFLAGEADRDRAGVGDDRPPVLPQSDPAESRYQVLLALARQSCLKASPQAVTGDGTGPHQRRDPESPWQQAAIAAHRELNQAARYLTPPTSPKMNPGTRPSAGTAGQMDGAAVMLQAGRQSLDTHVGSAPDGTHPPNRMGASPDLAPRSPGAAGRGR